MHKNDAPMLEAVAFRLKVGSVNTGNHFTCYSVISKQDLLKIFSIFDRLPLNTSKNLNYLMLKKGYELYYNRQSYRQVNSKVVKKIIALKDQMNKKRTEFQHPSEAGHRIIITPY